MQRAPRLGPFFQVAPRILAHVEQPDGRFIVNAVVAPALQPVIEPANLQLIRIGRCVGTKIEGADFPRPREMKPRSNDQALRSITWTGQRAMCRQGAAEMRIEPAADEENR